jgi:hypothetical protein
MKSKTDEDKVQINSRETVPLGRLNGSFKDTNTILFLSCSVD